MFDSVKEQTPLPRSPQTLSKTVAWSNFLPKSLKIVLSHCEPETAALNRQRENYKTACLKTTKPHQVKQAIFYFHTQ